MQVAAELVLENFIADFLPLVAGCGIIPPFLILKTGDLCQGCLVIPSSRCENIKYATLFLRAESVNV